MAKGVNIRPLLRVRFIAAAALALVLATAAYGFAASNVVRQSGAGDGEEDISGYTISSPIYNLKADPTLIDSIQFTITPAAGVAQPSVVKVQLSNNVGDDTWYTASPVTSTPADDTDWEITSTELGNSRTVQSVTNLRVVARGLGVTP